MISIVIAHRDRTTGDRLCNCLYSLANQTVPREAVQVIVSDYGSAEEHLRACKETCERFGAVCIVSHTPEDPWNKCIALNIGLRRAAGTFAMATDVDMIFAPNFLETVVSVLEEDDQRFVLCRCRYLPRGVQVTLPAIRDAFGELCSMSFWGEPSGVGGCQATPTEWFLKVGGYDEEFRFWGGEDNDMHQRALDDGLREVQICDRTVILHQWHSYEYESYTPNLKRECREFIDKNRARLRAMKGRIVRNEGKHWGEVKERERRL